MSEALFSTDGMSVYSMLAVGVVILIAIGLLVWNLRRRGHMAFMRGSNSRQPRLAVLDHTAVDTRRRLVLVRRDNVEHLIMIGGPSDIVVERGINRAAMRAAQQESAAQQATAPPAAAPQASTPSPVTPQAPAPQAPAPQAAVSPAAAPQPAAPQSPKPAQRPQQQKAPPQQKPAEPVAAEQAGAPAAKPVEKPIIPTKTETAAKTDTPAPEIQKPADLSPAEVEPATQTPPKSPAPELAAVAVSAVASDVVDSPAVKPAGNGDATITAELEDVLDAARDLVLPEKETPPPVEAEVKAEQTDADIKPAGPQPAASAAATVGIPVAEKAPNPEDIADATAPTVTADELIADFDRVLEAEMTKAEQQKIATDEPVSVEAPEPEKDETVRPPAASLEDEMKKLLGDLTVKH
ncbi:flagellar biosynthetic protein FliO [Hoeflea sp.]|uniref:flagellar biosynthetic protein FliO n=1 Tax=Hoeflea sp. TaxID=1940281 RepID=UPI003B02BA46